MKYKDGIMALDNHKKSNSSKRSEHAKSKSITPSNILNTVLNGALTAVILVFAFPLLVLSAMFSSTVSSPTAYNGYGLSGPKSSGTGRADAYKKEIAEQQKQSILLKAQQQRSSSVGKSSER
jgi:hypothetical protein